MTLWKLILRRAVSPRGYNPVRLLHVLSCEIPDKSFINIRGPDAHKFLNGLVTAKLIPNIVKKSLATISPDDKATIDIHSDVGQFDMGIGSWGIYKEGVFAEGPYISRFGTYAAILNSKGKILTDTIIYPIPFSVGDPMERRYPELLLQCDSSFADYLQELFETHKLLQKVKIARMKNLKLWNLTINMNEYPEWNNYFSWKSAFWEPMTSLRTPEEALQFSNWFLEQFFPNNNNKIVAAYYDTRNTDPDEKSNHFYFVTTDDVHDINSLFDPQMVQSPTARGNITLQQLRRLRFRRSVLEGIDELAPESLLPLEMNFDLYEDCLSFDKGCYVGQELTARTHATGILRKRCIAVELESPENIQNTTTQGKYLDIYTDHILSNTETTVVSDINNPFGTTQNRPRAKKKRPIGKLLKFDGSDGVALMRLDYIEEAHRLVKLPCYVFASDTQEKVVLHIDQKRRPLYNSGIQLLKT
ncbi:Iba57p Ecym_7199 [Eremothecium cymbalariae DBVPG|uniref:Uncharacterized protein n=1 Tax=Eremothecium cymbalariae (strain CBS 270.75 / DBVPG 7215 / KCTC 17166 / NRRL Y-17582) TaxID=931890 RepID=G8JW32_ERECY|nr:hypothetical protein Ecym_7199 [Eremothecium cymbalariae DBVPG\